MGQLDRRGGLLQRTASVLIDPSDRERITHSVADMLKQRVFGRCPDDEAHTKVPQRAILTDSATRAGLDDMFVVEALGVVPIRGKSAAVDVFAVSAAPKH